MEKDKTGRVAENPPPKCFSLLNNEASVTISDKLRNTLLGINSHEKYNETTIELINHVLTNILSEACRKCMSPSDRFRDQQRN